MKIVVTGGSGFIGSHIVDELSKVKKNKIYIFDIVKPDFSLPENVKYIDGDISYKTSIDKAIKGAAELYDCAGVLGTHELVFQTERAIDTNIKGAFNVIQSCIDNNVKKIFHPTKPYFKTYWENTYTISKITAENFCRMFREVYKMDITILRWMNASGPRQHLFPVRKFVPLVICQALLNKDIQIYGTGKQTRTYCYVSDAIEGFLRVIAKGVSGEAYNIGTPKPEVSMIDLVKTLQTISKREVTYNLIEYPPSYPAEEPMRRCPDIQKARLQLNFNPIVRLDDGLRRFLDWSNTAYTGEP